MIDWLDFDGVRRPFDTVAPGGELLRDAFVGHVWWVREEGGADVGAIVVGEGVGYVRVE